MYKQVLDIFNIKEIEYSDNVGSLSFKSNRAGSTTTKSYPLYEDIDGKSLIFKPLSKTKPLLTPLFGYAEVYWSYIVNKYFDSNVPLYQLAICKGLTEEVPKYYEKGTLVNSFLSEGQTLVNLFEYFKENPDSSVDISNYTNLVPASYNYEPFFDAKVFLNKKNKHLGEQLANQYLLSILMRNKNFHYENVGFIYEGKEIISMAPSIDHEFSLLFMFPESDESHDELYELYDNSICLEDDSFLRRTITLIVERYPEVSKKFIENIKEMNEDLNGTIINVDNNDYIESFSSGEYQVGHNRFKRNDPERADHIEKVLPRVCLNSPLFFDRIIDETINGSVTLMNVMEGCMELKEGKRLVR